MKVEKIFVVEDNKFFSYMLKSHLTKKINYDTSHLLDYEVVTFSNTKDCLAKMHEHPAMVIVEYNLKNEEMNGAEFVLQARHTDNNTKFLVISELFIYLFICQPCFDDSTTNFPHLIH